VQVLLRGVAALADRLGNLGRLAKAEANNAVAVADDDQSGKLHHAAALNGFGYTVDGNNLLL
jgi:hypothetical protein